MPRETEKARQVREARSLMRQAAESLRSQTGKQIAAGELDDTLTVPSRSRYQVATLLEALAHDQTLSEWSRTEAVALARSILEEDPSGPRRTAHH